VAQKFFHGAQGQAQGRMVTIPMSGDEGGFAPNLVQAHAIALHYILKAIAKRLAKSGERMFFLAARRGFTEFSKEGSL